MTDNPGKRRSPVGLQPRVRLIAFRIGLLALSFALAWALFHRDTRLLGQDLDLVLYSGDPDKPTLIDQIRDPVERDAFNELKEAKDPARQLELAKEFLKRYPKSWLVSFAHAFAAKAAIALDDLQVGLQHGSQSIRMLPENGTLLVALANVQVHQGLLAEAERSASDALEYLSRFRRPSHYSKSEWERIERDLEASAHFVLGRVAVTRGLRASADQRAYQLAEARRLLLKSVRMNPSDGIALFLLGLVEEQLGHADNARSVFAKAARMAGPVQQRALGKLRQMHRESGAAPSGFKQFLAGIASARFPGPDRDQPKSGARIRLVCTRAARPAATATKRSFSLGSKRAWRACSGRTRMRMS